MSFKLTTYKNGRSNQVANKSTSTAIEKGEIIEKKASGLAGPADSTTTRPEILGIASETISATDAKATLEFIEAREGDEFIADTANNTDAAHNNNRMLLSTSKVVNNTSSDEANGVVQQVRPFGAAADKKAVFKYV